MATRPEEIERLTRRLDRAGKAFAVGIAIVIGLFGAVIGVMALFGLWMPRMTLIGLAGLACIPAAAGMIYMLLHKPPPDVQARMDSYLPRLVGIASFLLIAGYGAANIFGIFMSRDIGLGVFMLLFAFVAYFMIPAIAKRSMEKSSQTQESP